MTKRTACFTQGGERTYIHPIAYDLVRTVQFSVLFARWTAFFRALVFLVKNISSFHVVYGEVERPYTGACWDPVLSFSRNFRYTTMCALFWTLIFELFLQVAITLEWFRSKSWLRPYRFHALASYSRNASLVFAEVSEFQASVYGYLMIDMQCAQLAGHCYVDVHDDVITEDLVAHAGYDFNSESVAYDKQRSVFGAFLNNSSISDFLSWKSRMEARGLFVSYLRDVDT